MADAVQTDVEIVAELGWTPLPTDGVEAQAEVVATPITAAPVVKPEVAPVAKVEPTPDPVSQALSEIKLAQVKLQVDAAEVKYAQDLVERGTPDAEARTQARNEATNYWRNYQLDQQNEVAKQALVKELAKEHGLDPVLLGGFNDPASMRAAAATFGAQAKEIASLKSAIVPKVPVQSFDGGGGAPATPNRVKQDAYVAGKGGVMTAAEFEAVHGWNPL